MDRARQWARALSAHLSHTENCTSAAAIMGGDLAHAASDCRKCEETAGYWRRYYAKAAA
jgi:hypothetical protein